MNAMVARGAIAVLNETTENQNEKRKGKEKDIRKVVNDSMKKREVQDPNALLDHLQREIEMIEEVCYALKLALSSERKKLQSFVVKRKSSLGGFLFPKGVFMYFGTW